MILVFICGFAVLAGGHVTSGIPGSASRALLSSDANSSVRSSGIGFTLEYL
jgi:hypothetical protein